MGEIIFGAVAQLGERYAGSVEVVGSTPIMSAIGADINAKSTGSGAAGMSRYSRVKGEAEVAIQKVGPKSVSIFRPSLIVGSKHTPRLLSLIFTLCSPLIPKKYRPIRTDEIARAMIAATQSKSSMVYNYSEMKKLIS